MEHVARVQFSNWKEESVALDRLSKFDRLDPWSMYCVYRFSNFKEDSVILSRCSVSFSKLWCSAFYFQRFAWNGCDPESEP